MIYIRVIVELFDDRFVEVIGVVFEGIVDIEGVFYVGEEFGDIGEFVMFV